jgi:hypothetical protein
MGTRIDSPTRELPPCKDCPDRIPGCHGSCDRYKEWKQRLDELNKARREYDRTRYNKYRRD